MPFALAVLGAAAGCQSNAKSAAGDAGVTATQTPAAGSSSSAPVAAPPSAAASSAAAAASAASAAASARSTAASTRGSTSGSASGGGTAATGTKTHAPAPGKPNGFTRAGTYTYDLSGTATQPFGGTQNVQGTQSFVVDPPSGATQHSRTSSDNGSQDMTDTVRSSGIYVDDIHITQQGFDEDFKPTGTALYFPADYHTGSHWSWQAKSTDGKYALAVTSKVSGSGSQTVGGRSQKALVIDTTLHITGSGVDITSQQRDWVSTAYALILKEHSVTNGTAYGAKLSSDITRSLRSTDPS